MNMKKLQLTKRLALDIAERRKVSRFYAGYIGIGSQLVFMSLVQGTQNGIIAPDESP